MTVKWLILLAALVTLIQVRKVYQLEQRFKQRSKELQKVALPSIQQTSTLQEQLDQYVKLHASQQFKGFKANPDYSSQVLLKKSGRWNQSLYFTGKELSNLLLEVTVVHKGDPHNHDKDSIEVYIINTATTEVLVSERIKHIKLIKVQVDSELYELRIAYDWSKEQAEGQEISKHIAINIDIDPKIATTQTPSEKDQVVASQKLKGIKDETDRIFMSSLQIWELIQTYHGDYFKHQEQVYLRAYVELLLVFAINCIEWLMLRKTLKLKSLI